MKICQFFTFWSHEAKLSRENFNFKEKTYILCKAVKICQKRVNSQEN